MHVYAMCMLTRRLQILISPEQQRRLDAAAKRRGTSVAAIIREAIDVRLGQAPEEQRLRSVGEMRAARGGRFVPPEELERIVEQERDDALPLPGRHR